MCCWCGLGYLNGAGSVFCTGVQIPCSAPLRLSDCVLIGLIRKFTTHAFGKSASLRDRLSLQSARHQVMAGYVMHV